MKATPIIILKRQKRRKITRSHPIPRFTWGIALAISLLLTASVMVFTIISVNVLSNLPSLDELVYLLDDQHGILLQPTRFFDRSGTELLASLEPSGVKRSWVQVTDPKNPENYLNLQSPLARAFSAYYDSISSPNSIRLIPGFTHPQLSAIAYHLANELLLWREPDGFVKIFKARLLAAQISQRYSKAQVLAWFLNSAKFGPYLYGVDTAARVYFGKPAVQLNLAESAALVAISTSPSIHPLNAPQLVRQQAGKILDFLLKSGVIQTDEISQINLDTINFNPTLSELNVNLPAFVPIAENQLSSIIPKSRLEMGGIKIITSINADLQKNATCVSQILILRITNNSSSLQPDDCPASLLLPSISLDIPNSGEPLGADIIILDNSTSQILALVSIEQKNLPSRSFQSTPLSPHPAGSILSPFIYLSAFSRGHQPASMEWDIPTPGQQLPSNMDNKFHGPIRARLSLANDLLSPAAQLYQQIGGETILNTTQQMGISLNIPTSLTKTEIQNDFTSYLKTQTTIIDIAQAYSIFANQGILRGLQDPILQNSSNDGLEPAIILSVLDSSGNSLPNIYPNLGEGVQEKSIISQQLAYLMTNVLSDESARWLVFRHPNSFEIGRDAAVKLGRSLEQNQFWSIGYTPQRLVGVWLGKKSSPSPQPELAFGNMAIWYALTQYSLQGVPAQSWAIPPAIQSVVVCDPSGLLPDKDCPSTVNEVFLAGNEPHQMDNLFQTIPINEQTGRLATVFTPLELVKEKTFMNIPPDAQAWAESAGIAMPPTEYDVIQSSLNSSSCASITAPAMFAYVHQKVKIMGNAACDGFHYYRLQLGKGLFPSEWLQIGSDVTQVVKQGILGEWDTSGLDGLYTLQLQVVGEENRVQTSLIQVTVDNTPPEISIIYPSNGEEISISDSKTIPFQFQPSDNITINQVEIYLDGQILNTLVQAPFAVPWLASPGKHQLKAIVTDQAGNQAYSEITFTVKP